ncbi:MAG: hypothetical protein IKU62_06045 [Ruminiclostridium sp.]|nr:hypothetical protein [Ruminiclostridium sp.]
MGKSKTMNCRVCGTEIAKSAKSCPQCGAKNKKPIYKKWYFWLLVLIIAMIAISSSGGDSADTEPVEYVVTDIKTMADELENNALNAEDTYSDAYLEITGVLNSVDSDGSYITVTHYQDAYGFDSIQCFVKDDTQLDVIKTKSVGDTVTVKGQISNIGELLGYTMDIHEIF